MLTKLFQTVILTLSLYASVFAQVNISGTVTDEQGPLPFCTILLLETDSTLITGETSDIDGSFTLSINPDNYILQISYVGYDNYQQAIQASENTDLGNIQLKTTGTELDEVVVTAQKQLIERKADRLVFNVGSSIAAQGSDLSKVIGLAPGVAIRNNTISMLGRGDVRVMVEGRLLQIQGDELMAFLSSISADDIDKIEVIANPPAQYEAAGNGGLINIIYKKGRKNSWKNTTSLSHTRAREGFTALRNSFQLNKDKHSFSLSLNGTAGEIWNTEFGSTFFPDGTQNWKGIYTTDQDNASGRITYDYNVTDKTTVGVQYQQLFSSPDNVGTTTTDADFQNFTKDTTFINKNAEDRSRHSQIANIHLLTTLDTLGKTLSFDVDYFSYRQKTNNVFDVNAFDKEGNLGGLSRSRNALTDQQINNYSIKSDVQHPTDFAQLSYGAKYNYNVSNNEIENFNRINGAPVFDTLLSNTFEYKEQIAAAYISGNRQFSDQWNLQLGLRVEYTATEGFSETLNTMNTNSYTRLFPTGYLSYKASDSHQWSWSVGGRVNRAGFRDLNPFRIYLNNTSYSEGNPFLAPSFTYTYNMDYVYKGRFTTSAFYNRTRNGFGTLFVPSTDGNVLATLRDNFYNTNFFGIGELFPINIGQNWSMQNQLFLFYSHSNLFDDYNAVAQNGFQYNISTNNNITLGKGWKCQFNLNYNSPGKSNLFDVEAIWSLDLGIQKKFLNNKLILSLQATDIFNTSGLDRLASEINGIVNTYGQNYSNRNVQLSLSYSFGNDKINVKNRNFGNQDTQRRL
ncbi:MAG: TonB-dependent receptor [Saprospiraceae bacterium]